MVGFLGGVLVLLCQTGCTIAHSAERCFLPPFPLVFSPKRGPPGPLGCRIQSTGYLEPVFSRGIESAKEYCVVCRRSTWSEAWRHVTSRLHRQHVCPLHDLTYRNMSCSGLTSAPAPRYCFRRQSTKSETRVSVRPLEHFWRQPATTGSSDHSFCPHSNGHARIQIGNIILSAGGDHP